MNGTTKTWLDAGAEPPDRAALGLPSDRFVWAYADNQGIAQGLDTASRPPQCSVTAFSCF